MISSQNPKEFQDPLLNKTKWNSDCISTVSIQNKKRREKIETKCRVPLTRTKKIRFPLVKARTESKVEKERVLTKPAS